MVTDEIVRRIRTKHHLDDHDVYLLYITTWQWVTKSIPILIRNQSGGHKYKKESIRKRYLVNEEEAVFLIKDLLA
jgi:predicted ABC-type ATPase